MKANQISQAQLNYYQALIAERTPGMRFEDYVALPWVYWSAVQTFAAGAPQYTFFQQAMGGNYTANNAQITNMPRAGSVSDPFLLCECSFGYWIEDPKLGSWLGTDATSLVSDLLAGVFSQGIAIYNVNNKDLFSIPRPFYSAAEPGSGIQYRYAGLQSLTLAEAAPNTFTSLVSPPPDVQLGDDIDTGWVVDAPLIMQPDVPFSFTLRYTNPGAAANAIIPLIATTINNDTTNTTWAVSFIKGFTFQRQS